MADALCLLGALDSALVKRIHAGRVVNIANVRNLSIYAHGTQPMSNKAIEDIRHLAIDTIQAYSQEKGIPELESNRSQFEFIPLIPRKSKT